LYTNRIRITTINLIPKPDFTAAKKTAEEILDACPVMVIQQFISQSYRFVSAYRIGLTGKATEWAVHKQKQHCQVSQGAMMAIKGGFGLGNNTM